MCMDLPDSGLAVYWILFITGYNLSIYLSVDLVYIRYCLHPGVDSLVVQTL